jgi:hypothetical protein
MPSIFLGPFDLDAVPPVISNQSPAPLSVDVPVSTSVSFDVTDVGSNVNTASIDVTISGQPAIVDGVFQTGFTGSISVIANGYAVAVTPDSPLDYSQSISVQAYAEDLAGIPNVVSAAWSFTTEEAPDINPPEVINRVPASGATTIPVSTSISFSIVDYLSDVDAATVQISVSGSVAFDASLGGFQAGFTGTGPTPVPNGFAYVIQSVTPFPNGAVIDVEVIASDVKGNSSTTSYSFTTLAPSFGIGTISAYLTNEARKLIARGLTEGFLLGDWSFQVGSGGYNPLDPTQAIEVDPEAQTLLSPIGVVKPLGNIISFGSGASAVLTSEEGVVQIDGLSSMPVGISNRYLSISGAASDNLNGTWSIRQWLSPTSVTINAPLVTESEPGPLSWGLREFCTLMPNDSAVDFRARLVEADAVGFEIAEVAIFCRVLKVPSVPVFPIPVPLGSQILFANSHFPPFVKDTNMVANFHICVQV